MDSYHITANGTEYNVDRIKDKASLEKGAAFFMTAMAKGDGLSKNEFASKEAVLAHLTSWTSYLITRKTDMAVIAVMAVRRSPLVRSENTIYHAQYMIIGPEYRGSALATYTNSKLLPIIAGDLGYRGSVSRAAIVSKIIRSVVDGKWMLLGTIPNSMYFPQHGWVEDVICYSSCDPDNEKILPVSEESLRIPPLIYDESKMPFLNASLPHKVAFPPFWWQGQELSVTMASATETFLVEEMLRDAAREGKGLALDEFNSSGHMNRSLYFKSHVSVVKTKDGAIKAGVVFGPTSICRESNTTQACGCIVVNNMDRGKGLGSAVLDYCLNNMELFGYTAILTDVYVTDLLMLAMLQRRGFLATGSIPNSGFVKGKGRTNTYLMYKQRINIKHKNAKL